MAEQVAGPERIAGKVSGLSYEVEACPDADDMDTLKAALGGGAIGWGLSFLFRFSRAGRMLGAAAGVAAGVLATRYHVNLDWDPDALRAGGPNGGGSGGSGGGRRDDDDDRDDRPWSRPEAD